eukprot:3247544-Karenia_brevis.AAC.1
MPFVVLRFKATLRMVQCYLQTSSHLIRGLFKLLSHSKLSKSGSVSGVTWLELMFLSLACSDVPLAGIRVHTAAPRKTIALQLREFVSDAMHFIKFLFPPHSAELFHASFT